MASQEDIIGRNNEPMAGYSPYEIMTIPSDQRGSGIGKESLTQEEIARLRHILQSDDGDDVMTHSSNYSEFQETTHAWMIFQDCPAKKMDRFVGTMIIAFQLFTYSLFAAEAIEDYQKGLVAVSTTHEYCLASNEAPGGGFMCEAERTNALDALVSFIMLGIFLASDIQQAFRSIRKAPSRTALIFASLAGVEVVCAFLAASVSISQKLYIGEVTDAVEVGVGLLFIRELSTRAYHGIRQKKTKQYRSFFFVLVAIVVAGLLVHPVCQALFAP